MTEATCVTRTEVARLLVSFRRLGLLGLAVGLNALMSELHNPSA